jgi:hypothetical protein
MTLMRGSRLLSPQIFPMLKSGSLLEGFGFSFNRSNFKNCKGWIALLPTQAKKNARTGHPGVSQELAKRTPAMPAIP